MANGDADERPSMKPVQESIADLIAHDRRPVHEWAESMERLRSQLYERDPKISRELDNLIQSISSSAADLDCIGTDDPSAPRVGAPTDEVLAYFFRRWPEEGSEFRRLIARTDQLLGRRRLLEVLGSTGVG